MPKLNRTVLLLCRMLALFNWLALAASLLGLTAVCTGLTDHQLPLLRHMSITVGGANLQLNPAANDVLPGMQAVMFIGGTMLSLARALMFHSVSGVLLTAYQEGTPFRLAVVGLLRRIGILAIVQPVIVLAVGLIASNHLRTEIDLSSAVIGLMVLCLAQYFAQGVRLQQDADSTV